MSDALFERAQLHGMPEFLAVVHLHPIDLEQQRRDHIFCEPDCGLLVDV
ncbi:MAG: hypothetical protein ABIW81_07900 [Terrimesophilobacter sp.]